MTGEHPGAGHVHYGDHIEGDGIRQYGDHNIGKIDQRGSSAQDLRSLAEFVVEVQKALPHLGLDPESRKVAQQQINQIQIATRAGPANLRLLTNLAGSLRTIVQSAATTALTTWLTGLWTPPN